MNELVKIIRIGRNMDNSKYILIFDELGKITRPVKFEPGYHKTICEIEFERTESNMYLNPTVNKFISIEKITPNS